VIIQNIELVYGDLAAGQSSSGSTIQRIRYSSSRPGNYAVQFSIGISTNGVLTWNDTFSDFVTGIGDPAAGLPQAFALEQNFPNPFNPSATIQYDLPKEALVTITVYNTLGQLMTTLVHEKKQAGHYQVQWNVSNAPSGIYFYRLQAGKYVETKKAILLK
jgi:hypothetical protein